MRSIITTMSFILVLTSFLYAQKLVFKIKGSDTCLPLSQKEAEEYMKNNPGTTITVTGGGSGVGLAALINGATDIAQTSRKIESKEIVQLKNAGKSDYIEDIIAYDALSIIVNPNNKISKLTREQIEGIFTGKIENWKQLGGDDLAIVIYSRELSSGTHDFIQSHVLMGKKISSSAIVMPATGAIIQSVSQTKGAIGYVGIAYLEKTVKPLDISYDKGKTYITPNIDNAKNKTYPIVRPLYYYYLKSSEAKVKSFIDFIKSDEGQKIVVKEGFISIK